MLKAVELQPVAHFAGSFLKQWPHTIHQTLVDVGLLARGGLAKQSRCHHCAHGCIADVEWHPDEQQRLFPYLRCNDPCGWGIIPVDTTDLQVWNTSFSRLTHTLAGLLGMGMPREEVIASRLWWLGEIVIDRRIVDIFLARGATWTDATGLFRQAGRLLECPSPMVLVPWKIPVPSSFPAQIPVRSLATLLRIADDKLHICLDQLADTIRHLTAARQQSLVPFHTPEGATWLQLLIEFVNDEYVHISMGHTRQQRSFLDMGFADLRKPKPTPTELWEHFRALAKYDGRIGWNDPLAVTPKTRDKVRKWISEIRRHLQAVFPNIQGDPFEPYQRVHAYQVKCLLRWSPAYRRSVQ